METAKSAGRPGEGRYRIMRRVTLAGAVINTGLAMAQLVGGVLTHSQALIADGAHTLSDLASDFMVLFASRKANAAADARHPYGHGRIETLATVAVGMVLLAVAMGIVLDAGRRLLSPDALLAPTPLALFFAVLAIVSKEALYHYTMRSARKVRSRLLEANAWHHRSDVVSSIVVLIGVGATLAGLPFMDAAAAILVAVLIGRMGAKMIWRSAFELIDTGVEPEEQERLLAVVRSIDGVRGAHALRTRRMGSVLLADVHVLVAPRISVSEGHRISDAVADVLKANHEDLDDVLVHIDPEDDQRAAPSSHLPGREALLAQLEPRWREVGMTLAPDDVMFHYLDGKAYLELQLPLGAFDSIEAAREAADRLGRASRQVESVARVRVSFRA
ncbi:cation diffusion facilitator family transporter [Wenzhouxiangella sp. XN24]|uniref:cation diffusion facilitator family transporter n=1 Tax=Wenzhouxiangella sp. XN24 TaxID=2713569 RepID=UPI0013EB4B21|nr:cation diffusion facilitator family transporter [Wenzhouxiangella sp. XN24]NGX14967.1 cation transporter [Wenzhouxiangella sp. XN24]